MINLRGWAFVLALVSCSASTNAVEPPAKEALIKKWPASSHLKRRQGQRQFVMFADPYDFDAFQVVYKAAELRAASGAPGVICFVGPSDAHDRWFRSAIVKTAEQKGLTVHADRGGFEALRFGAKTNGVCYAFDSRGRLCFHGGLMESLDEAESTGVNTAMRGLSHTEAVSYTLLQRPTSGAPLPIGR